MSGLVDFIFGARPPLSSGPRRSRIDTPPRNVKWRRAQARPDHNPVRAWRAEADTEIESDRGLLHAHGASDMIVAYGPHDYGVVRRDIFDRTYIALGGGLYRKRDDVILRYFICPRPSTVVTMEGEQDADPGDWIMLGESGEMWPVRAAQAEQKYRRV